MSEDADSRKSRLQILRERQKKLRESYKSQINISRRTLKDDEDGGEASSTGRLSPMPALSELKISEAEPAKEAEATAPEPAAVPVDTAAAPISPAADIPTTPKSAPLVLLQTENEELKREIVALKADRDLILERQMERFQSASEQLNEMEVLLEDYRFIAEESEENNAVLQAQVSLMTSEEANWKKEKSQLRDRVKQQQERLDSSVQAMNELEKALDKAQDDLQMSDQHVMNLEHQLRNVTANPQVFQGQVHSGTTYFPPQQQTVFYPVPGDGKGGGPPMGPSGRNSNRPPHNSKPLFGGGGPGMPPQRRGSHNGPPPQQQRRGSYNNSNKGGNKNYQSGGGNPNFPNNSGGGGVPTFNPNAPNFAPPESPNPDNYSQGNKKKRR